MLMKDFVNVLYLLFELVKNTLMYDIYACHSLQNEGFKITLTCFIYMIVLIKIWTQTFSSAFIYVAIFFILEA